MVHPIQGPRTTQGKGLPNEIVVRERKGEVRSTYYKFRIDTGRLSI